MEKEGPADGDALHSAAQAGDPGAVKAALADGARVNEHSHLLMNRPTPLTAASAAGHTGVVRLLLERGADADLADGMEMTPLMHASQQGHAEVVRLLMEAGTDINARDSLGNDAMAHASSDEVRILLQGTAVADEEKKKWWQFWK
ncbi:MAG: ankyrin repeat domain-containing protein [Candidatus Aegiribacteria sp.]